MKTSRRSFLTAVAAAMVLDPERLLWVPGAKTISIPKPRAKTHPVSVQIDKTYLGCQLRSISFETWDLDIQVGDKIMLEYGKEICLLTVKSDIIGGAFTRRIFAESK